MVGFLRDSCSSGPVCEQAVGGGIQEPYRNSSPAWPKGRALQTAGVEVGVPR